eukprot:1158481-Pelagomonas_calceolata.AAC.2
MPDLPKKLHTMDIVGSVCLMSHHMNVYCMCSMPLVLHLKWEVPQCAAYPWCRTIEMVLCATYAWCTMITVVVASVSSKEASMLLPGTSCDEQAGT